jgi:hypothetical protein
MEQHPGSAADVEYAAGRGCLVEGYIRCSLRDEEMPLSETALVIGRRPPVERVHVSGAGDG